MNPARFYLGTDTYFGLNQHPYASPLYADHFDNLPPILIQSGGCETMKDEVRSFATKFEDCHSTIFKHEEYEVLFYLLLLLIASPAKKINSISNFFPTHFIYIGHGS